MSKALKHFLVLVSRSQYDFFAEGKWWHIKNIPLKRKWILMRAGLDDLFPRNFSLSPPTGVMIEPTDLCNLKCTGCWTIDECDDEESHYLSFEGFRNAIDNLGDNLFIIWLWGWGEPFLNKDIYKMIKFARRKKIVTISSTNFNLQFGENGFEDLVKSGLSKLIVAIDGVDQETYGKYRIGGKLDLVLKNIKALIACKNRLGSQLPLINMRMVVMRHNQHQIEEFFALGKSLGVDIVSFKTMCDYRKDNMNLLFPTIRKYQRYAMDDESRFILDINKRYYCKRPWRRLHIFANGDITFCEFDHEREYLLGNVYHNKNIKALWNNPISKDFRNKFLNNIKKIKLCTNCPYKNQIVWDPTVEHHYLTEAAKA